MACHLVCAYSHVLQAAALGSKLLQLHGHLLSGVHAYLMWSLVLLGATGHISYGSSGCQAFSMNVQTAAAGTRCALSGGIACML